jgi:hypothetical protein
MLDDVLDGLVLFFGADHIAHGPFSFSGLGMKPGDSRDLRDWRAFEKGLKEHARSLSFLLKRHSLIAHSAVARLARN